MNKLSIVVVLAAMLILNSCNSKKNTRVVAFALDGISVEGFAKAKTPNLDKLLSEGAVSNSTRIVMPSVTLPNWTSHLLGSGPEQHGVVNNGWTIDKHVLPAVVKDSEGYYPSLFNVLKSQVPNVKTAFYYNWINLFYPYNKKYLDEVSYLENDAYVENYNKAFDFVKKNKDNPTMVFLYSVHTDHAGHKHKWMSPEYIQSIEEADVEIGKFLAKMKKEELYEDTHFMFLSDHGGKNYGHGGVTTTEMEVPWGVKGKGIKKGLKITNPNNSVNTASLIVNLFGAKQPECWTGEVPEFVFE